MQDVSSAIHFVLICFPILCNRKLLQLPSLCSLSTTFTGFFLCTLHTWSLKDNVCNLAVPLPLAFSTPFCYLKYCFSIMFPTPKHLQNQSPLMRETGTWIHTCSCPSRYHSYISHDSKLPCIILDTKFVQNLQNFVTGRSPQLSTTVLFSLNFIAAETDLWVLRCSLKVHTQF